MASMQYIMMETDVGSEPRLRALADDPIARLTYFGLMTSSKISYSGYFRYPIQIFEYESMLSAKELDAALTKLVHVGLIEHDRSTEFVRIVGWFYGRYAPENVSRLKSVATGYLRDRLPNHALTVASIAEFVIGALVRSKSFHPDKDHTAEYYATLQKLAIAANDIFDGLPLALEREVERYGRDVRDTYELLIAANGFVQTIDHPVGHRAVRVNPGCGHPAGTVPSQENRKEEEQEKERRKPLDKAICTRPLKATLNSALVKGMGIQ